MERSLVKRLLSIFMFLVLALFVSSCGDQGSDKDLADNIQVQAQMFGVSDPGKVIVDRNLPGT